MSNHNANNFGDGGDIAAEEDPRAARWREHYLRTEARLASVLGGTYEGDAVDALDNEASSGDAPAHDARPAITPKKLTRTIDEDDYGDDEDDEDDDDYVVQCLSISAIIARTPKSYPLSSSTA